MLLIAVAPRAIDAIAAIFPLYDQKDQSTQIHP